MTRKTTAFVALVLCALVPASSAVGQDAPAPGTGSPNLSFVKNIPYEKRFSNRAANYGTDIEFARLRGRPYALAGSYRNGLQIIDITRPAQAQKVAVYECGIRQGDVQVFPAGDRTRRTLVSYTADIEEPKAEADTACFREAEALGFEPRNADGTGKVGTFIVDVSDPRRPTTVSFVEVPLGSHNQTVHPSGKYLYNSNSELITETTPEIELVDLTDPDAPKLLPKGIQLQPRPGLGTESHDITFSADGKRAYSAALSHGAIIDTSDPAKPKVITEWDDEAINVWHQVDPVRIGGKDLLIAEDEFAGAAGGDPCPSGGVHVYDVTGDREQAPVKVGYWNIDPIVKQDPASTCTAHVFDIHEAQQLMTIAFYDGGVRVVDLAGLAKGEGMKEIAGYRTRNADTWSFKAPRVSRTGVFYAYGNDIARGLDIYRYDGAETQSENPGTWLPAPVPTGEGQGVALPGAESAGLASMVTGAVTTLPRGVAARRAAAAGFDRNATMPAALSGYRLGCLLN